MELTREQKLGVLKRELKFAKKLESDRFKFFNKTKGKLACESWLERKYIVEVLKEKIECLKLIQELLDEKLIERAERHRA